MKKGCFSQRDLLLGSAGPCFLEDVADFHFALADTHKVCFSVTSTSSVIGIFLFRMSLMHLFSSFTFVGVQTLLERIFMRLSDLCRIKSPESIMHSMIVFSCFFPLLNSTY